MYEAAFKNIDDTLWKDAGCSSELDYIEQTSWILFLKYLAEYEIYLLSTSVSRKKKLAKTAIANAAKGIFHKKYRFLRKFVHTDVKQMYLIDDD